MDHDTGKKIPTNAIDVTNLKVITKSLIYKVNIIDYRNNQI